MIKRALIILVIISLSVPAFAIEGDFNNDEIITLEDLALLAKHYNIIKNDHSYNKIYDINNDSIIDIFDVVTVSKNIGVKINYNNFFNYKNKSIWLWEDLLKEGDNSIEELLNKLDYWEINRVYIDFNLGKVTESDYKEFIKAANERGIKVEALYGDNNWAISKLLKDNKAQIGLSNEKIDWLVNYIENKIKAVIDFNNNALEDEKFSAIHLDIEPHAIKKSYYYDIVNLEGYIWENLSDEDKRLLLESLVNNIKLISEMVKDKNLDISIDLNSNMPIYLEYVDELHPYVNNITLMNYTLDNDRYKNQAIAYLEKIEELNTLNNHTVTVNVGSEFQNNDETENITLYHKTRNELSNYFKTPITIFSNYNSFSGISIHCYKAFDKYFNK